MANSWVLTDTTAIFQTLTHGTITVTRATYDAFDPAVQDINVTHQFYTYGYHEYSSTYKTNIGINDVSLADMQTALVNNPTPIGDTFAGPGWVYHGTGVDGAIINITVDEGHILDPGVVQRRATIVDGKYEIVTNGIDEGYFAIINKTQFIVDGVWGGAGENLIIYLAQHGKLSWNDPRVERIMLAMHMEEHCFPAEIPIPTSAANQSPISSLTVGSTVLSFDPHSPRVLGETLSAPLAPARVTRLFTNITDEWLVITPAEGELARTGAEAFELTVTPGHEMLDAFGRFRKAIDIVNTDARLVRADGRVVKVEYSRVVFSAATAHLYEEAEILVARSEGGLALQPEVMRGWKNCNFEVETYHTYVAGGFRVCNNSLFDPQTKFGALGDNVGPLISSKADIRRCGTLTGDEGFTVSFDDLSCAGRISNTLGSEVRCMKILQTKLETMARIVEW